MLSSFRRLRVGQRLAAGLANVLLATVVVAAPGHSALRSLSVDALVTGVERAAAIDGCNRFQTLYKVVLPLAVPGLIAAGLFAFIASWNEFIFALILAQDVDSMTVTYVIAQIFGVILYGPQNYGTLFAAGIIAILPPVILAFVFQRFLVQGLTAGSVKG